VQQGLQLNNIAIATSGDYRNYYEKNGKRYSHTINPKTGYPITHKLASVTVLNQSTMIADAQATAIMVLGEEKGKTYAQQQNLMVYMIIRDKNSFSVWHNLSQDILIKTNN
jgi:thiamine biosynthesis lipoprotein